MNKLCWHSETIKATSGDYGFCWAASERDIPEGIKRIRVTCPKCGRRLLSSIEICHDGCCVIHKVPVPHKVKGWWKKKKSKRNRSYRRHGGRVV